MPNLGATEWLIILAILLLLFGGKKIPEFFKGVGDAIKEFKKGASDDDSTSNE